MYKNGIAAIPYKKEDIVKTNDGTACPRADIYNPKNPSEGFRDLRRITSEGFRTGRKSKVLYGGKRERPREPLPVGAVRSGIPRDLPGPRGGSSRDAEQDPRGRTLRSATLRPLGEAPPMRGPLPRRFAGLTHPDGGRGTSEGMGTGRGSSTNPREDRRIGREKEGEWARKRPFFRFFVDFCSFVIPIVDKGEVE